MFIKLEFVKGHSETTRIVDGTYDVQNNWVIFQDYKHGNLRYINRDKLIGFTIIPEAETIEDVEKMKL